jgi:two-component system, NtrC family, response regulator HydG
MKDKLKILIVDDDQNMAHTLADILAISGYEPLEANSPLEGLKIVQEKPLDCVLTDVRMPRMSGIELLDEIQKINPNLPVILMTAYAADELTKQGLEKGAMGLLAKPFEISLVLNFLTILSEERCIAVVDDDPAFCKTLAEILTRRGYKVKIISDPSQLFKVMKQQSLTVLLDIKLSKKYSNEVLAEIRKKFSDIPVVLITAYRDEMSASIKKALELDAFTFLYKPLDIPQLLNTFDEILKKRLKNALQEKNPPEQYTE